MNDLKRYVLTKDNRIIDFKGWTTTVNGVDVPLNHISRIRHILGTVGTDATYEDYLHTIKAQSDNVFDLIEVGDLVRYVYYDNSVSISNVDESDLKRLTAINSLYDNIRKSVRTIYKPNEKGDYIKVWEVVE